MLPFKSEAWSTTCDYWQSKNENENNWSQQHDQVLLCLDLGSLGCWNTPCYRYHSMRHKGENLWLSCFWKKKLKCAGFLFLNQKTLWYSGKSLELGFRSHKCFISDIHSPYARTSYSITWSLNWLMEIIFLPHGGSCCKDKTQQCLWGFISSCGASQLESKSTLDWSGHV